MKTEAFIIQGLAFGQTIIASGLALFAYFHGLPALVIAVSAVFILTGGFAMEFADKMFNDVDV